MGFCRARCSRKEVTQSVDVLPEERQTKIIPSVMRCFFTAFRQYLPKAAWIIIVSDEAKRYST